MATILSEGFENAGYQDIDWTELADGGSTVDEDDLTANAEPLSTNHWDAASSLWSAQCLKIVHVASTNAYAYNTLPAGDKKVCAFSFQLSDLNFTADGQTAILATGLDSTGSVLLWYILAQRVSATEVWLGCIVKLDGVSNTVIWLDYQPTLGKQYTVEVVWDIAGDVFQLYVNGIRAADATLTATQQLILMLFGATSGYAGAFTMRVGWVIVDDANLVLGGAWWAPSLAYSTKPMVPAPAVRSRRGRGLKSWLTAQSWW